MISTADLCSFTFAQNLLKHHIAIERCFSFETAKYTLFYLVKMSDEKIVRQNVAVAYDTWSSEYDSCENPTRDLDMKALREQNLDFTDKTVVEFGCGTGRHTQWIASTKCRSVLAMDLSSGMLDIARKRVTDSKVTFLQCDITREWPLEKGSVDVIFGDLVLEHIEDMRPFFDQVHKTLKPGGTLFICELHPIKQILGSKARLEGKDGSLLSTPPCFYHDVSDYVMEGLKQDLNLVKLEEWRDVECSDSDKMKCVPRLLSVQFVKPA